jgi:CDP-diacylglycerol---glycerol-3-phosphate 3-phosphatidyltransferase
MGTLKLNLPTILTLSRIVLIPVFIFTVYMHPVFGAFIFGIASLTDFFDGYLARRSGDITKFGIILDPIADKFLIISALIVLVDMARLPAWIAITIIVREFLVTGLRVVALSKDIVIAAELGGKIKTTTQIIAILCLILNTSIFGLDLYDIGLVLIWIALIVSIFSGIQYTILFGKKLK